MKISHPEHGGNGVSACVVNQWLRSHAVELRARPDRPVPLSDNLLHQIITRPDLRFRQLNLFDCAGKQSFCALAGAQRKFAMIETVTAVMGLVSAGIFLAHAFEGYRSRA
jgi:hypothetical protein